MVFRGMVIGCGFFAQNHLHAWAEVPGVEIVAVCDVDRDKAAATAARFGIKAHSNDAAALLASERPDFVDIVTTSPTRRQLIELAAVPCRVVVCQKPMADSYPDAPEHGRCCRACRGGPHDS